MDAVPGNGRDSGLRGLHLQGDPMADPANPKKVLGLIWDMAVDQL